MQLGVSNCWASRVLGVSNCWASPMLDISQLTNQPLPVPVPKPTTPPNTPAAVNKQNRMTLHHRRLLPRPHNGVHTHVAGGLNMLKHQRAQLTKRRHMCHPLADSVDDRVRARADFVHWQASQSVKARPVSALGPVQSWRLKCTYGRRAPRPTLAPPARHSSHCCLQQWSLFAGAHGSRLACGRAGRVGDRRPKLIKKGRRRPQRPR